MFMSQASDSTPPGFMGLVHPDYLPAALHDNGDDMTSVWRDCISWPVTYRQPIPAVTLSCLKCPSFRTFCQGHCTTHPCCLLPTHLSAPMSKKKTNSNCLQPLPLKYNESNGTKPKESQIHARQSCYRKDSAKTTHPPLMTQYISLTTTCFTSATSTCPSLMDPINIMVFHATSIFLAD